MKSLNHLAYVASCLAALVFSSHASGATCSSAASKNLHTEQDDLKRTIEMREVRIAYVHAAELKLEEIKSRAKGEFGEKLPSPAAFDERVLQLRSELASMVPKLPDTPQRQVRAERIRLLTGQMQMAQQQSAKDWMLPQNQSPEGRRALEDHIRDQFRSLSSELATLVDAENAEQEAAITNKEAVAKKRRELVDAIAYTELQDRQDLIDGAKQTIAMYDRRIAEERARIGQLKADGIAKGDDCQAQSGDPMKKS